MGLTLVSAVLVTVSFVYPQQPTLGELLYQAQQMERVNPKTALKLYRQAIELAPNSPILMLKTAKLILEYESENEREAAQLLCKAWNLLLNEPITAAELRVEIFQTLFKTTSLHPYRCVFMSLSPKEQQEFVATLRENDPALTKSQIANAYLLVGEFEKGVELLRQAAIEGNWSDTVFLLQMDLPKENLRWIQRQWRKEALKTRNPNLWLAVMKLACKVEPQSFRKDFKTAFEAVKGDEKLMKDLAELALQCDFEEGYWEVYASIKPTTEPQTIWDFLAGFDHALATRNLTMAKRWVAALGEGHPVSHKGSLLAIHRIRKMVQNGWRNWLAELLTPESFSGFTLLTILKEEEFSEEHFNFWVKRFLQPDNEKRRSELKSTLKSLCSELEFRQENEKALRLLEWSVSIFPEDVDFLGSMARKYKVLGYWAPAYESYQRVFIKVAGEDLVAHRTNFKSEWLALDKSQEETLHGLAEIIHSLFEIATRLKRLSELRDWLWAERQKFALPFYVLIAKKWWQENEPGEAVRWIEEALRVAKERNWTGDASLQAKFHSLPVWAEREKLRTQFARTEGLFYPETFILRVRCLLALGKRDEAKQIASEAKSLYPNYPFHFAIHEWKDLSSIDWDEAIRLQAETMQDDYFQESIDLPIRDLFLLAWTLVRSDRCNEASKLAEKFFPERHHLVQGLLLAFDLFKRRVEGCLPFWKWLQTSAGNFAWGFLWETATAIKSVGETSLANALVLTVLLCSDESVDAKANRRLIFQLWTQDENWQVLNPEDKAVLEAVIAKRLNPSALQDLLDFARDETFRNWLSHLRLQFACRSATLLTSLMEQHASLIPKEHWQAWLNALSATHWDDTNDDLLDFRVRGILAELNRRKLTEEARSLLQIALQKLSPRQRLKLWDRVVALRFEIPDPKDGDWSGWLLKAKVAQTRQKQDEALSACLTALKFAPSLGEKLEVLDTLAELDPVVAFNEVSALIVAVKPNGEFEGELWRLGPVFLKIAIQSKNLAEKVATLVDELEGSLPKWWTRSDEFFKNFAWVYFLANKPKEGIETLFGSWNEPHARGPILASAIDTMVVTFLPSTVKETVFQRLKLLSEKGELTEALWAEAMRYALHFTTGSLRARDKEGKILPTLDLEGLNLLASLLETSVLSSPSVSEEFLEMLFFQFTRFAGEPVYTSKVAPAWFQVLTKAVLKLIPTFGDQVKAAEWLRERLKNAEEAKSRSVYRQFMRSEWFKKLRDFANELLAAGDAK